MKATKDINHNKVEVAERADGNWVGFATAEQNHVTDKWLMASYNDFSDCCCCTKTLLRKLPLCCFSDCLHNVWRKHPRVTVLYWQVDGKKLKFPEYSSLTLLLIIIWADVRRFGVRPSLLSGLWVLANVAEQWGDVRGGSVCLERGLSTFWNLSFYS